MDGIPTNTLKGAETGGFRAIGRMTGPLIGENSLYFSLQTGNNGGERFADDYAHRQIKDTEKDLTRIYREIDLTLEFIKMNSPRSVENNQQ